MRDYLEEILLKDHPGMDGYYVASATSYPFQVVEECEHLDKDQVNCFHRMLA